MSIYTPTEHQVSLKVSAVGDTQHQPQVIVNEPVILAMREDLLAQLDYWITDAKDLWVNIDGTVLDDMQDLAFRLSCATEVAQALAELIPA